MDRLPCTPDMTVECESTDFSPRPSSLDATEDATLPRFTPYPDDVRYRPSPPRSCARVSLCPLCDVGLSTVTRGRSVSSVGSSASLLASEDRRAVLTLPVVTVCVPALTRAALGAASSRWEGEWAEKGFRSPSSTRRRWRGLPLRLR